jgi:AraC-like DNA-binding protein
MPKGKITSKKDDICAITRFTTGQSADGQEIEVRQGPSFFDRSNGFLDRDTQAQKINYLWWDLGVVRLEQVLLPHENRKAKYRSKYLADRECLFQRLPFHSDALAYVQEGALPDLNFRILIASLNEGGYEQVLTVYLPCTLLPKSPLSPNRERMETLGSWQGTVLADYLLSLARELPSIPKEHWSRLGEVTCTLLRACLAPASNNSGQSDTSHTKALRERLRSVVRQHMSSPGFGPLRLGQLAAMSRSKLYRIFEGTGGVARFIQEERLGAARRRLANITDKTSIRTLANEIGFLDHSTFSRAFKLRYGSSPTEFREMVSADRPLEPRDRSHYADSDL